MTSTIIKSKQQMYKMLSAGAFGNTIPQYYSLGDWETFADLDKYPQWGVRCLTPGDPRMRLYVPTGEVADYVRFNFPDGKGYNISSMIDQWVIMKGDVWECDLPPYGVWAHLNFQGMLEWREAMRRGKTFRGASSIAILKSYLTPSSYSDLREVLDAYPGHVVEISACDRNVGVIPGRNAVVWEVRCATGEYERPVWRQ